MVWAALGAGDPGAARQLAMAATIFHWALHPWAIYAMLAWNLARPYHRYTGGTGQPLRLANPIGRNAFYWAWWISWSPFVGMFIARVSRGRTVREFIISVLIIPSLDCVLWMTVFGATAIHQFVDQGYKAVAEAQLPLQLYAMLDALPMVVSTGFPFTIVLLIALISVIKGWQRNPARLSQ